ncbi:MAG: ADP-ribosylglycohydrolase family protein, partial [Phycisphaerae bacterium]
MPEPPSKKDRFRGCLIGQCLGDALGMPVEGASRTACRRYVDAVVRPGRPPERGRGPFPFGQVTDDSQLARELLESYTLARGFDPVDYARRIADLFAEGRIVGQGRATTLAAERLQAGVPWDEAGTPPPQAGNGSAMRAGPVGLMAPEDPDRLVRIACDQGRITHADSRCSAGAVAIAGAVALALRPGPLEPEAFAATLAGWAGRVEPAFAATLAHLPEWAAMADDEALPRIAVQGLEPARRDLYPADRLTPFVVPSVLWSLRAFLVSPDDYLAAMATAVGCGGDVDTTAAMAGAVSGARLGLAALPQDLAGHLTDRGTWGQGDQVVQADEAWAVA